MMTIKELKQACDEISSWLEWDSETINDFQAFAHRFGAPLGSNVYTFVLTEALRARGVDAGAVQKRGGMPEQVDMTGWHCIHCGQPYGVPGGKFDGGEWLPNGDHRHGSHTHPAFPLSDIHEQPANGCELIARERIRQIGKEGWTPEHDDEHDMGEMALAACCYASPERLYYETRLNNAVSFTDPWPWEERWDKRSYKGGELRHNRNLNLQKRIDLLVKAGALIAAEIDRLQRLDKNPKEAQCPND